MGCCISIFFTSFGHTYLMSIQDDRDGLERLCHTSFELHSPLVLEGTTQHPQYLPWEVRRPRPHHWQTDPLKCLCQVQHQCHCSQFFFPCSILETRHLHQYFPHCQLSSSISPISGVPINVGLLLPLRHLRCSQSFSPTCQSRHKRKSAS